MESKSEQSMFLSFESFNTDILVVNEDLTAELKRIQMEREKAVIRLNEINPRRSKCYVWDGLFRKGLRPNETRI